MQLVTKTKHDMSNMYKISSVFLDLTFFQWCENVNES